jgi:hypothetical protein
MFESIPSNSSYKSFKTWNVPLQNSYCDHRNFDSVKHAALSSLITVTMDTIFGVTFYQGL